MIIGRTPPARTVGEPDVEHELLSHAGLVEVLVETAVPVRTLRKAGIRTIP